MSSDVVKRFATMVATAQSYLGARCAIRGTLLLNDPHSLNVDASDEQLDLDGLQGQRRFRNS